MQLDYEIILLNKILRNHFLFESLQWNYVSFNVTLIYLMHDHGILHDIFFGSQQLRAKILSNSRQQAKPVNSNYFRKIYIRFSEKIAWLLGKIKNTVSLRFRSLTFASKKSSSERTCPYCQWIVFTEKGQWPVPMVHQRKNIRAVCCEDNYFPNGKFKFFNSLFLSVYLVFLNTFDFYCRFICRALFVGRM